jgi:tetratricopeptide (TPR) repeat protein
MAIKPSLDRFRCVAATVGLALVVALALGACNQTAPATPPAAVDASPAPGQADDLFAQGNALSAQGKFDEAEAAYRRAIAMDPNKASYWQNLAVTYYQLQRLSDAEQSLQSGLKLAPNDAQLNYLLGVVYLQQARFDDAGVYLLKANAADPALPEPYYGLGVLYKQQGKRAEAIASFEKFLELGPGQDPAAVPNARAELAELKSGQ